MSLPLIEVQPFMSFGSSANKSIQEMERSLEESKSFDDTHIRKVDILEMLLHDLKISEDLIP